MGARTARAARASKAVRTDRINVVASAAGQPVQGILKGGSITVQLTSCLTGLESSA